MSVDASLDDHIARTGTTYGVCVVYPFHAPHVGMPDLFHVRCSQHPDFGLCAEWDDARRAAINHDANHRSADSSSGGES